MTKDKGKAAEKARRRRARQREDAEKRAKAQDYERARYLKKKDEGKVKSVKQLTARERKARREKWREAQRKSRGLAVVITIEPDIFLNEDSNSISSQEESSPADFNNTSFSQMVFETKSNQDCEQGISHHDNSQDLHATTKRITRAQLCRGTLSCPSSSNMVLEQFAVPDLLHPSSENNSYLGLGVNEESTAYQQELEDCNICDDHTMYDDTTTNETFEKLSSTLNLSSTSSRQKDFEPKSTPDSIPHHEDSQVFQQFCVPDILNDIPTNDDSDLQMYDDSMAINSPCRENFEVMQHKSAPADDLHLNDKAQGNSQLNKSLESLQNQRPQRERKLREDVKVFLATGGKRPKRKPGEVPQRKQNDKPAATSKTSPKRIKEVGSKQGTTSKTCPKNINGVGSKQEKLSEINRKLRQRIKALKLRLDKYRKANKRLTMRLEKLTPTDPIRNKVKALIGNRSVPEDITEKLVEHAVLEAQLESTYKSMTRDRDKDVLRRVLAGKVIRKYRKLSYVSKFAPKRNKNNSQVSNLNYKVITHREKVPQIAENVTTFYEMEGNSRMTTGVNNTITRNGVKKQRMYLMKTMQELHEDFLKTVDYSISYSKFCSLRPFWVLPPKVDDRETCACKKHVNMELILTKLHIEKVIGSKSSRAVLSQLTCDTAEISCMLRECDKCNNNQVEWLPHDAEKEISYHQHENVTESYDEIRKGPNGKEIKTTKKVKKLVKKETKATIQALIDLFHSQLNEYMRHVCYMNHQFCELKAKREGLNEDEVYLWVDFAENWSTKMATETQGLHFGGSRQQFTLHTGVGYLEEGLKCYCTLSECRSHGPTEIMAHLIPVIEDLLKENNKAKTIHFQSDGPVTQYRGKEMYAYLAVILPKLFPQFNSFSWNYTEAGHGRGSVDGVGSDVKREADRKVAQGEDIDTFDKFVACSKKLKNVHVDVVSVAAIQEMKKCNISASAQTFHGNNRVHQLTWSKDSAQTLMFNYLSCFQCSLGSKCSHFNLGRLYFTREDEEFEQSVDDIPPLERVHDVPTQVQTVHEIQPMEEAANDVPVLGVEQAVDSIPSGPSSASQKIVKNNWVVVKLSSKLYPGIVQSVRGGRVSVKVMMRNDSGQLFLWPPRADIRKFDLAAVEKMTDEPREVETNLYMIPDNDQLAQRM